MAKAHDVIALAAGEQLPTRETALVKGCRTLRDILAADLREARSTIRVRGAHSRGEVDVDEKCRRNGESLALTHRVRESDQSQPRIVIAGSNIPIVRVGAGWARPAGSISCARSIARDPATSLSFVPRSDDAIRRQSQTLECSLWIIVGDDDVQEFLTGQLQYDRLAVSGVKQQQILAVLVPPGAGSDLGRDEDTRGADPPHGLEGRLDGAC